MEDALAVLLDALFTGGRITTLDAARPTASALGVLGGLVGGLDEELAGCTALAQYDVQGAPAVPGLHDAHAHLSLRGQELQQCDVSPGAVGDLDGLYAALALHAAALPAGAWVLGHGLHPHLRGGLPDRAGLAAWRAAGRSGWCTCRSTPASSTPRACAGWDPPTPATCPTSTGAWSSATATACRRASSRSARSSSCSPPSGRCRSTTLCTPSGSGPVRRSRTG